MKPEPEPTKETRLNLRVSAHHKAVIQRAAELRHTTVSDFVLGTVYEAAQRVVDEETHIKMPKGQWAAFLKALDAPPKRIPALRKLLTESGPFDEPSR